MTWILGAAIPFGYGALISDVRVTWPDGNIRDVLQKVYPVGSMMMAGFAGSVSIGFALIEDMERSLRLPTGNIWEPKAAAWHWRRRGRGIFASAPGELKALGASVVVVGVSPERNGPFLYSRCVRMRAPTFDLEVAPPLTWLSIGTGTEHQKAADYTQNYQKSFWEVYFQGEVANPGGAVLSTASSVAMDLERNPMTSVSNILQVGTVWPAEHRIQNLERQHYGPAWSSSQMVDVPDRIAKSWEEFIELASRDGLRAEAAAT